MEEKNRNLQGILESNENKLRSSIEQSTADTQNYARAAKEELERKLVYREDIGNKLIELGMGLTKDLNSGNIVQAIEDGTSDFGYMDALEIGDDNGDVASVDDILNLMGGGSDDEALPPPQNSNG